MLLHFFKFHASGCDYLLMDNREGGIDLKREDSDLLLDRRKGIGAELLMLLERPTRSLAQADFRMRLPDGTGDLFPDPDALRCFARFASVFREDMQAPLLLETPWGPCRAEFIDDKVSVKIEVSGLSCPEMLSDPEMGRCTGVEQQGETYKKTGISAMGDADFIFEGDIEI